MTSIATLQRISATDLSTLLLAQPGSSPPSNVAIIDVRDDDHIGGHIRGSTHIPSSTLDTQIPSLVRKLQDKETVIFHCALSQQRGPGAALRYLRERGRMLGTAVEVGEAGGTTGDSSEKKEQTVLVLDRGFVGWQEKYGKNERLTEGYSEELWSDGYWM